ncbi:MAG: hypothetical protein J6328_02660 [Bacilli bacterium]|nr:hypothetical protein [Bacilli bacterium]
MNKFARFFKEHRNKIFAVTFSALALLSILIYYLALEIASDWFYFRNIGAENQMRMILELWNAFFYIGLVYGPLLVRNINNDGNAYQNIMIFVFATVFSLIYDFLLYGLTGLVAGDSFFVILLLLTRVATIAEIVFGILLYVNSARYMKGYAVSWKKIRLFAILFAACIGVGVVSFFAGLFSGSLELMVIYAPQFAELCCAVAIIFTLERLRRY